MVSLANENSTSTKVRMFFHDETRLGLIPVQRRRITLRGVKPVGKVQHKFESYYLYGAVEPCTGENFFLELPYLNSDNFQVFLNEFFKEYSSGLNIMVLDNGSFHKAKELRIPQNVIFLFLPAYSPELNPIERLWEDIKGQIAFEIYMSLETLKNRIAEIIKNYTNQMIRSLTSYPYVINAIYDAFQ
jgi:transposase